MTSSRITELRSRIGSRGLFGLASAIVAVSLTGGVALAYNGNISPQNLQADPGGSSAGSLGSLGSGDPSDAPTTPVPTTEPSPSPEPPAPAANELPIVPHVAEVSAVEQECHITIYYGPLTVHEGRSFVITAGPNRSVLGPTEVGASDDGTTAYRLTDPVDYRERSIDRTYYAMEVEVLEDGSQLPLENPTYHHLGHVPNPADNTCSAHGREIAITDSAG